MLKIPFAAQEIIDGILENFDKDSSYKFMARQRYDLYKTFNSDKTSKYLSIIAATKILPFWEQELPIYPEQKVSLDDDELLAIDVDNLPKRLLELGFNLLRDRSYLEEAKSQIHYHWITLGNIGGFELRKRKTVNATKAAYTGFASICALSEVTYDFAFKRITNWQPQNDDCDAPSGDSTVMALKAYATIDLNKSIDNQKRLEFWRWWLSEAVYEAWELTH